MPDTRACLLAASSWVLGCAGAHEVPLCIEGTSVACACTTGASGAQRCGADGRFAACVCDVPDAALAPLDAARAPDAARSADAGLDLDVGCTPWLADVCDGLDGDCDGSIDEGHLCPEVIAGPTEPFVGSVWVAGSIEPRWLCTSTAIQRLVPSVEATYSTGFECTPTQFAFRPSDGALLYRENALRRDVAGVDDPVIPTPPCDDTVFSRFGFDATERLYYACTGSLHRDGELLARHVEELEVVLPSGRSVVARYTDDWRTTFALLDERGDEVSRPDLSDWSGDFEAVVGSATTRGDAAWMLLAREFGFREARAELLSVRVDGPTGRWDVVRRVMLDSDEAPYGLALPDGRVLTLEADSTPSTSQLVERSADGAPRVLWRELDSTTLIRPGLLFTGG